MQNLLAAIVVVASVSLTAKAAHADEPPAAPPATTSTATAAPTSTSASTWGWILVGTGLAGGGSLTSYGLFIECGDEELSCMKWASTAIWTGIGIASLATAIGIAIVQADHANAANAANAAKKAAKQSAVSVSVDVGARPGLILRGTF